MEEFTNFRLKGVISLVGILLAIFLAVKSWEVISDFRRPSFERPTISVNGEGKVFAKPDIGQINLAVSTGASTVTKAQEEASAIINRVFAILKERGIEEKDIKTTSYSINPRYDYPDGRQILKGYQVSQNLEVRIRDLAKVGEIISAASSAGANQIGGLSFTTEDPSRLQSEARAKAIEDAEKKAKELSEKLGVRLGRVVGFSEFGGPPGPIPYFALGKGGDQPLERVPEIPVGENEILINVSITYQIK